MDGVGEIVWLGRYPVKSMLGECPETLALDAAGVVGDRRFALVDAQTSLVASAKHPRKWRALLTMGARLDGDARCVVTLPDGSTVASDDRTADAVLSAACGRDVQLRDTRPVGAALERETPFVEEHAGTITRGSVGGATSGDSFVDFAPLHIVTTATLAALAREHPQGTVDARRFRPNIVIETHIDEPFVENGWSGRTMTTSRGTVLRMIVPTPRCPIPSLAHGQLDEDVDVLRVAAKLNRVQVLDRGRLTCVGCYATVQTPGDLAVGDLVWL